jgi:hypothetical protein
MPKRHVDSPLHELGYTGHTASFWIRVTSTLKSDIDERVSDDMYLRLSEERDEFGGEVIRCRMERGDV